MPLNGKGNRWSHYSQTAKRRQLNSIIPLGQSHLILEDQTILQVETLVGAIKGADSDRDSVAIEISSLSRFLVGSTIIKSPISLPLFALPLIARPV